jgi:hypothetical protein
MIMDNPPGLHITGNPAPAAAAADQDHQQREDAFSTAAEVVPAGTPAAR